MLNQNKMAYCLLSDLLEEILLFNHRVRVSPSRTRETSSKGREREEG
jgi:hypothetical protein